MVELRERRLTVNDPEGLAELADFKTSYLQLRCWRLVDGPCQRGLVATF